MGWRLLFASAIIAALTSLSGCQGSGGLTDGALAPRPAGLNDGPEVLPAFPAEDGAPAVLRVTAAQDNVLLGKDYWDLSATGAAVAGNGLALTSGAGDYAWGIWRWGVFGPGILPETLRVDATVGDGSEYWLLLSDYDAASWEIQGPFDLAVYAHNYDPGVDYISPDGYSYAAILVAGGSQATVNQLTLISDEDVTPPAAPTGLAVDDILSTSVNLSWTANSEPDLDGYTVYSGPTPDFTPGDAGVVQHGQAGSGATTYTVVDLTPEETYHFRITAFDIAGGESPLSESVMAEMPPAGTVDPPTDLTVDDLGGSWVDLSWTAPVNPSPIGYEFYTGPAADFEIGGPGVVKRNEGLIGGGPWQMTGLQGETEYYCRGRAYYLGAVWSELSEAVNFTTLANIPPVPNFIYSPLYPRLNEPMSFNPSSTSDADTPLSELTFSWDFDGDDVIDETTTGPDVVHHTYTVRGPYSVKLTASDGSTPVDITKAVTIGFQHDYGAVGSGSGETGVLVALDASPADSRVAAVTQAGASRFVRLYSGSSWQTIATTGLTLSVIADVALSSGGLSLLDVSTGGGGGIEWTVYSYNGSTWTTAASQSITAEALVSGALHIASNGRLSVATIAGDPVGEEDLQAEVEVWHQKADTTFSTSRYTGWSLSYLQPCDVRRSDTTSYFIYGDAGDLQLWTFTDGSDSLSTAQTYAGSISALSIGQDDGDLTHIFWAGATDGSRIYYGDNYGTANGGTQYYATPLGPTGLLGAGLVGDNEGLFCWTDEDANSTQKLLCYDTTADGGSGELYTIVSGAGGGGGGGGCYYDDGVVSGVYTALNETRDGEVSGRFISGGTVQQTDAIYLPQGDASIDIRHRPVILADGAILSLSQQIFSTARGAYATAPGESYSVGNVGDDTWCVPDAACRTAVSDEYFVASYTPAGMLDLNRFTYGNAVGTQEGYLAGTSKARLLHNPASGGTLLCYATNGNEDLSVRTWNGTVWSADTPIYDGAVTIEELAIAGDPDGEWAAVLIDSAENLELLETSGGVWGSAVNLSTESTNGSAGIGIDYHADGHLCIAVERDTAEPGIYLGLRPDGGSFSWSSIVETVGAKSRFLYAFYHESSPVVLYYQIESPIADSRMRTVIERDGGWGITVLDFQMHGSPVGAAIDASGNIVLTGYSRAETPRPATVAILYN